MTFQDFLQFKTAQAIVEHVETLSDAEARELIDQLDEQTIELIEAVLSEGEKRIARQIAAARNRQTLDPQTLVPTNTDDEDALKAKARAKGLNIRSILRQAETIRNQGSKLDSFGERRRVPKDEVQADVDFNRKERGKAKQTPNPYVIDPRSSELRSKVDRNKYNREQKEKRKLEAEWMRKHGHAGIF